MYKLLFAFLISATTLPLMANDIDKLAWLTGVWSQNKAGETVQESWLGPSTTTLVGVNLTTSLHGKTSFEYMRIAETQSGITFFASPAGQPATEFKMKELSAKRVVFENLTNDFPHRVIYRLAPDGTLRARIEGTLQGKREAQDWHFLPAN